jgi:hypothetical protein
MKLNHLRWRLGRPSPAMIVALMALFVALGGTTYAATGGNFILGQSNTAGNTTSLSAPLAGKKALQLTNTSTGAGATALGLNVASGHTPFTVNSGTKVANLNADKLDGKDSTNWKMADVISAIGPLPAQGTYTSSGGKLLIMASGSGYRASSNANPGRTGMEVKVDGNFVAFAGTFTNDLDSHKAFVTDYAVLSGLAAGPHTIRVEAFSNSADCGSTAPATAYCTSTDGNDLYHVSVMEIPS